MSSLLASAQLLRVKLRIWLGALMGYLGFGVNDVRPIVYPYRTGYRSLQRRPLAVAVHRHGHGHGHGLVSHRPRTSGLTARHA